MKEPNPLPTQFETERLILKRPTLDFAEMLFSAVDADRIRLRVFLPWVDRMVTIEDERQFIDSALEKWILHEAYVWAMFRKQDHQYLGNIGVHACSAVNRSGEMGYWICGQFEGQGFVTEAGRELTRLLFMAGYHRVVIRCAGDNLKSSRVPEKLGYRLDGRLREDFWEGDRFTDTLIYAKIKSD